MTDKFTRIVYNVIKDADIIIEVLDARNPLGTRSNRLEILINQYQNKKLVLLLNKADLIPSEILHQWIRFLSKEYPVFYTSDRYGFQNSIRFLKKNILKLTKKRPVRVCLVGYPNVGKSSIINALRKKKVAPTSPLAGFTHGKKYIKLAKGDIFLIDTPGVIPFDEESEVELVLRGAIRPDKIYHLLDAVDKILSIVSKDELFNKYGINYTNTNEFLEKMAYKRGRLGAKGIADIKSAAKILINDFQRGRIKYYFDPPK
ncbi:MAG: GTPase [Candidatus Helarchaeota archaeon]